MAITIHTYAETTRLPALEKYMTDLERDGKGKIISVVFAGGRWYVFLRAR